MDISNFVDPRQAITTITIFIRKDTFLNTLTLVLVEQVTMVQVVQDTIHSTQNTQMARHQLTVTVDTIVIILKLVAHLMVSDLQMIHKI